MDYQKSVVILYDYFYNKIYRKSFRLDLSRGNHKKLVENFLTLLGSHYNMHSVGANFLIEYFQYSFAQWYDRVTQRNISLSWIIGKKAVTNFKERTEQQRYFANKFWSQYDIDVNEIRNKFVDEPVSESLDITEENEKKRFVGDARLFNCIEHTTLYNHLSKVCVLCPNNTFCKKLLKDSNKLLYEKRGYK